MKKQPKERIKVLDGLRAVAILSVMLFHFFSRYIPPNHSVSLYPYNNEYDYFQYGRYGVNFFFMISGFVIVSTLEKTPNMLIFWKNRLIRLWPSMMISSIIIFLFLICFDKQKLFPTGHQIINFASSITMVNPYILSKIFKTEINYLNGSFWSLWPELQFYTLCCFIYFFNKKSFFRNYLIISICITISYHLFTSSLWIDYATEKKLPFTAVYIFSIIGNCFDLVIFLNYFSVGVFGYQIFKNKNNGIKLNYFSLIPLYGFMFIELLFTTPSELLLPIAVIFLLFLSFIFFDKNIKFIGNKFLAKIGLCSYFLYLIHEPIGVVIINMFGKHFEIINWFLPLVVIAFLIIFSSYYYNKVETKITSLLKNHLIKN